MRVRITNSSTAIKREFRAYHITWVAEYGTIPNTSLQYSHRCHNGRCVSPAHGVWETDQENKARNKCQGSSHLELPSGAYLQLCTHIIPCLSAAPPVLSWLDPRVIKPPQPPVSSAVVFGSVGVLSSPPASPGGGASAEAEFEVDEDFEAALLTI